MSRNEKLTRQNIPVKIRKEILQELTSWSILLPEADYLGLPGIRATQVPITYDDVPCTLRYWSPYRWRDNKISPTEASGFGLYTKEEQKEFYSLETRCILNVGGGVKVYELVEKVQENLIPEEWKPIVETLSRRARELDDQCKGEKELMRRIAAALQDTVRIKKNRISLKDL